MVSSVLTKTPDDTSSGELDAELVIIALTSSANVLMMQQIDLFSLLRAFTSSSTNVILSSMTLSRSSRPLFVFAVAAATATLMSSLEVTIVVMICPGVVNCRLSLQYCVLR